MKYFVTGGSGFIGSNFIDYVLEDKNNDVVNFSRHTYAFNPHVLSHLEGDERYKFIAGDLTDGMFLLRTLQREEPYWIVDFAASTHVDRSFTYPQEFFNTNAYGTFTLLEAIRHLHLKPELLYVSTDEVFGDVPTGFCKEEDRLKPRNPYSASKAAAEMYVGAYHHSFDLPVKTVRLMNNYGPRQHPEKLISKIITRCLTNTPFTLFEGGSVRGWIYVKDACRAIDTVLRKGENGEVYHVPADTYKSVPEIAEIILHVMGKQELFEGFKGTRLKDDERYSLSGQKLVKELMWRPRYNFERGIDQTIKWFSQNEWFWKGIYAP